MTRWDISSSHISFFESALSPHDKVVSFSREGDNLFRIQRTENMSPICAVLVDIYTIGVADVIEAKREFPEMTCLVTCGNWNGYTPQAKQHGMHNSIGIFNSSEFFGALWWKNPHKYVKKDRDGKASYAYRSV